MTGTLNEQKPILIAHGIYAGIILLVSLPITLWVAGTFADHVARAWLLTISALAIPLKRYTAWFGTAIAVIGLGLVLNLFWFIAYGVRDLEGSAPTQLSATAIAVTYLLSSMWLAGYATWRITHINLFFTPQGEKR